MRWSVLRRRRSFWRRTPCFCLFITDFLGVIMGRKRHNNEDFSNNGNYAGDAENGNGRVNWYFENGSEEGEFEAHSLRQDDAEVEERSFPKGKRVHSTERFDASTQGDQTSRNESVAYERAVLVGVYRPNQRLEDDPLDELARLAEAARVAPVGTLIQRRMLPDVAFCLGSGKLQELEELIYARDAEVVIFDLDLSPGQTRNLEKRLKVKVIDRTELILDVFANRAQTREARLAVELAQLEYSLPRLKRMWTHLERQTVGGVGLRGPGEKQLEVDKRIAQKRIGDLKRELNEIHSRKKREIAGREDTRRVCLVGYTNAGKSSLLNALTQADVFAKDMLFATLDTRTRRWSLPGWGPALLSDTVGFVRDLPHHLVASFRATLAEVTSANLLMHVADASSEDVIEQIEAAHKTLDQLGILEKDEILVLNKIDVASKERVQLLTARYPTAIPISARTGEGLEKLTSTVSAALSREFIDVYVELPIKDGKTVANIARDGEILSREYGIDGRATIHARLPKFALDRLRKQSDVVVKVNEDDGASSFDVRPSESDEM